ncbi:MAG: DNA translocase FtsK [Anaerolineaceae bacterium]|jgi:S-DNA-T family DNA segregation ATPase FtsK/SpoIIIE|nr:DNA translocase FtsK [Anaerolineaceae bacterium]
MSKKSGRNGNKQYLLGDNPKPNDHQQNWINKIQPILSRYGLDFFGVIMFAGAVLTLFGLVGWTTGSIITNWVNLLKQWFGWGSYFFVIVFVAFGFWSFRKRIFGVVRFSLSRVLAIEISFFILIVLFSIYGGMDLQRAESGMDGGFIGWGLANLFSRLLPEPILSITLLFLFIISIALGSGFFAFLIKKLDNWSEAYIQTRGLDTLAGFTKLSSSENEMENSLSRDEKILEKLKSQTVMTPAASIERQENLPPFDLLAAEQVFVMDNVQVQLMGEQIERTLEEFGVPARVAGYRIGPTVTQFAVEPGFVEKENPDGSIGKHKVRVSQISSLARDLALALSAERLRVEAPVPGRSYVGIEVPNMQSKMVRLRPVLESEVFQKLRSPLSLGLGQDVSGQPVVADLIKMPHLLIAGTTGSGKSVCVGAITTCLLMNNSPDNLRIAMLDPKMVELVRFNGVPHLLGKVETTIERMVGVLRWAISEMDQRYRLLEEARARDLDAYNTKMARKNQATLPRIVIIIDELADLMLSSPDQTEHSLVRLAQMARAVGMHLIVATQRPSVDVVTGLIKANFPARIAFTVASSIDSRVILDMNGAESLMGKGDMLFLAPDVGAPQRAQGVIVTDHEIDQIIDFWRQSEPIKLDDPAPWEGLMKVMQEEGGDDLVKQAINLVKTSRRASASLLQRRLRIGFPRAARLLDQLEEMGVVGPSQGGGKDREVMIDPDDDWDDIKGANEDEE